MLKDKKYREKLKAKDESLYKKKTFIVKRGKEQPKITNLAHTRQP